jgi:hypothetical protein
MMGEKLDPDDLLVFMRHRNAGEICQCGALLVPYYDEMGNRIGVTHQTDEEDVRHFEYFAGIRVDKLEDK